MVATALPHRRGCVPFVVTFSGARAGNIADVLHYVTLKILIELLRKLVHDHPIILGHDVVSLSSRISTFRDNVLISPSTVDLSFVVNHL
jgi:hypothetical protein